ncbi:MAG: NADP-dependent malic enzyme [Proteobacteria bacterium]|nr:NADP-dependent malic enzyme [Pseudomonadota bacterium]
MSDPRNALEYHSQGRPGKIEVVASKRLSSQRDLSLAYTPGVADACRAIHTTPSDVFKYTAKGNLVAVVTNGTAVLGLGDIGPEAGKPVMEGKANLFKKFADIDVFDIELNASTADEMVAAVKAMAPTFGGINLEDIKAPECFEVERRLQEELDIPVFHDDQHGTAIISAAALLNAIELTNRDITTVKIVFSGAGAAAVACAELYVRLGAARSNITMFDSEGPVTKDRTDLFGEKAVFAQEGPIGTLGDALVDADVFVGLSVGNVLSAEMLQGMAARPIVFAMANPDPEIPYAVAKKARPDAILATGRSDHPNQVNNVLGFPFVFRGALDCRARKITEEMKVAATRSLAALAREDVPDEVLRAYDIGHLRFGPEYIIPKPFDARVLMWVAPAIARAAEESGVAREPIANYEAYTESLRVLVERARGLMSPLIQRLRLSPKARIVFPDGTHPQIIRTAQILVDEGICQPVLLGPKWKILKRAEAAGIDLTGVELDECEDNFDLMAKQLWHMRQRKGMTHQEARTLLRGDRTWWAAMMVRRGLADGMVGGLGRAYSKTLSPALRVLGKEDGTDTVSGTYAMVLDDRKIFFGDCTVNVQPSAEQLAQIALNTAKVAEAFGQTPRVAMLSYSDFGEHRSDDEVRRVAEAVRLVRERRPELEIDGEMQADTALLWEKMRKDFPFSTLTGPANVLIFPNLTAGNIAYKLVEELSGAEAVGPLLVGLGGPVNVIPVHASVTEIANVAAYTAHQVLHGRGV